MGSALDLDVHVLNRQRTGEDLEHAALSCTKDGLST